jgi:hypothetical protein
VNSVDHLFDSLHSHLQRLLSRDGDNRVVEVKAREEVKSKKEREEKENRER